MRQRALVFPPHYDRVLRHLTGLSNVDIRIPDSKPNEFVVYNLSSLWYFVIAAESELRGLQKEV